MSIAFRTLCEHWNKTFGINIYSKFIFGLWTHAFLTKTLIEFINTSEVSHEPFFPSSFSFFLHIKSVTCMFVVAFTSVCV